MKGFITLIIPLFSYWQFLDLIHVHLKCFMLYKAFYVLNERSFVKEELLSVTTSAKYFSI